MRIFAPSMTQARTRPSAETRRLVLVALNWLAPIAVFGAIVGRRWWQYGDFATGLDAGSWYAIGDGLFGQGGRATDGAFPPLVPVLLHLMRPVFGEMGAAKLAGAGSLLAIMVATYLIACRGINRWFALAISALVGMASILAEPATFGGYPQNLALAFLLLAALGLARYLAAGRRRDLAWTAAALAGAGLTHHMYFGITGAVVGVVWLIWLTTRPEKPAIVQRTIGAAVASIAGVICFLPTFVALLDAGYDAPINAAGVDLRSGFRYSVREAPWLWTAILVTGGSYLALTHRRRTEASWQVATALIVTPLLLFPPTSEPRTLPPLLIGASLGAGLALQDLWTRHQASGWSGVPATLAIALPILLWPQADAVAADYVRYYRVVDQPLLDAAAFVEANHGDGLVVVRQNRRGWPVGWWFEGLTDADVAVGSLEKWLAFPEERENALLAAQFFERGLTTSQVVALAAEHDVDFLVFRKREWIGWERWLAEPDPALRVAYDDGEFMILDVRPR